MIKDIHDDIIQTGVIDRRISELANGNPERARDDDEQEEFEKLTQFRDDVISECGAEAWTDSSGILADSYFPKYTEQTLNDLYGREVILALDAYLDLDSYEDDQREKFTEIDLDGVTYLVDKE